MTNKERINTEVANKLKAITQKRKLSTFDISKAIGIPQPTVWTWINGTVSIPFSGVVMIVVFLKLRSKEIGQLFDILQR